MKYEKWNDKLHEMMGMAQMISQELGRGRHIVDEHDCKLLQAESITILTQAILITSININASLAEDEERYQAMKASQDGS